MDHYDPRQPCAMAHPMGSRLLEIARRKFVTAAERIRTKKRTDQSKLNAVHAPQVKCVSKGQARKPRGFRVKVSLTVGARYFTGNPFDGHTLATQLKQNTNLLNMARAAKQIIVASAYRGADGDNTNAEIIHRGEPKSPRALRRKWLKRHQTIEPLIGHTNADHGMKHVWLTAALGDALHVLICAALQHSVADTAHCGRGCHRP